MKITVTDYNGDIEEFDADHAVGASGSYPYWVIWEPVKADGNQAVHFIPKKDIKRVTMYGPPDGHEDNKPNLNVVPLQRGGDTWDNIDA